MNEVKFEQISPADFFYRNRDIAGFTNPSRALYMSIRELVENSLDACEIGEILPLIKIKLTILEEKGETDIYRLYVEDNGIGVDAEHIPRAFATVLYGSKYSNKQSRGTFGLGGTMALLYGQITTNQPATVISSKGKDIHEYKLMIDIVENKPRILDHKVHCNNNNWRGTIVDFTLEADYQNSKRKIIEYLRETSIANPHATISFIDPKGRLYLFERVVNNAPKPPKEALPHPLGIDAEAMIRLLSETKAKNLFNFLTTNFQKVGAKTAKEILELAGLPLTMNTKKLKHEDVTKLIEAIKKYKNFRAPDASTLSPIGIDFLKAGIIKEFQPEFIEVVQRPPSAYSGFPFIVEVALAYGGKIPISDTYQLYRFANKIPLLYDERADVSWKVVFEKINWNNYKVPKEAALAIFVHLCSTRIPYKTVGKEAIADRPEIEREITIAIREAARSLKNHLSKIEKREEKKKRLNIFIKYLPKIAQFSAKLSNRKKIPSIEPLLRSIGLEQIQIEESTT